MVEQRRDIEAEITYLPTEHGGRSGPDFSGYRGQLYYDGQDWDAPQEFADVSEVLPGQTVRAYLWLVSPQHHLGKLVPGKAFLIREGNKTVAYGTVRAILDLERSANASV
jgi:elongation factor Tu